MAWTLSWIEIAGFVTGALCVWLVVRRNIWNFPIGLANNIFFWVLFMQAGLYGDAWLQVVYLVLGALGWYWWLHGGANRTALVVRRTPVWGAIAVIGGVASALDAETAQAVDGLRGEADVGHDGHPGQPA